MMVPIVDLFNWSEKKKHYSGKVLLLDRDGTINVENGYMYKSEELEIISDARNLLSKASQLDIPCVVVTNQSAIGRGIATLNQVRYFNQTLVDQLSQIGCRIDAIILCPHQPESKCPCRKPKISMIVEAQKLFPKGNFAIIGDKKTDLEAGLMSGIPSFSAKSSAGYRCAESWLEDDY